MTTLKEKLELTKTLINGYKTFKSTGKAPHEAWLAMRKLFVETNGWSNDIFQFFFGLRHPKGPMPNLAGSLLKGITEADVALAAERLRDDGYYVFPQRVEQTILDKIMHFGLTTPTILQYDKNNSDDKNQSMQKPMKADVVDYLGHAVATNDVYFDPNNLIASNYRFAEKVVVDNPTVQNMMADPLFLSLAEQYMRSAALYTTISVWWTTPYGCNNPSAALAQQYHFDMDRFKFLKFFLYITDVGEGDGPHTYVKGSCRRKPKALQKDGRRSDAEIAAHYDPSKIIEFIAPRGTLIAEDTRGWHKAKMPSTGNRLILEFEFASSAFGPPEYPRSTIKVKDSQLQNMINKNPYVFSNFDIVSQVEQAKEKVLVGQK